MGGYYIRKYEDKDYEAARAIFSDGIRHFALVGARHALSCPQTHLLLLGAFLLAYVASASVLFSLGVVSALLVLGWNRTKAIWLDYVRDALREDMRDIRGTYLERKDCCFWVVEHGEEVVGTVAVTHPEEPSWRGRALELKRMSVKKEHRGRGISKALTRTVIRFAQERGYKEVVLGTSMVQHVAQRLYESMGFRRVQVLSPSLLFKLLQFYVYIYSYEIPESH
ncbi:N-acetyltransferase 8B-like [Pogona vitticeps]